MKLSVWIGWECWIAPILVILIYLGPILTSDQASIQGFGFRKHDFWIHIRNLVAGPIAEEWVFRACICPMLKCEGYTMKEVLWISPGLFGLCHLHHLINLVRAKGYSVQQGIFAVGFQLVYTSLFGAFATFVFWKTGNVLGVILAHSLCNFLGLPDLSNFSRRPVLHLFGISMFIVGMYGLAMQESSAYL
jgi:prenyl protein peptidase